MSFLDMDMWQCAILHAPLKSIVQSHSLEDVEISFLPDAGDGRFLADPFGLWRDEKLYIFAELYDYRTAKGEIEVFIYDRFFQLLERKTVLKEKWHLSYPYVFEHQGEVYMLPEGYKSGRLSLYRAVDFPFTWERVSQFDFPIGAIDATPLYHAGRWWLFWTPPTPKAYRQSALHLALAEELTGAWSDMGCILVDPTGARPGGTPLVIDDKVVLPVQDCSRTYGGGIRFLQFHEFGHGRPRLVAGPSLIASSRLAREFPDGMHTLSAAGDVTLIDLKKIHYSLKPLLFSLKRRLGVK
ncbi:hypothetical protein GS501_05370 [Saccharibacter sp. 17.LH.SD]|uniref:glucosamine inositolphosphorylceramide transferase family protein n=1 Tax=Saccharibacter sp. 17.LH.SD TaxID=2689393 RepID=UPI00136BDDA0|nr:hypothetical protein [Saccharibacter sp. 17.LH.SD]MXV44477.1 hypothetical protein [Saccharibacter sp. 17.LH.SD]